MTQTLKPQENEASEIVKDGSVTGLQVEQNDPSTAQITLGDKSGKTVGVYGIETAGNGPDLLQLLEQAYIASLEVTAWKNNDGRICAVELKTELT